MFSLMENKPSVSLGYEEGGVQRTHTPPLRCALPHRVTYLGTQAQLCKHQGDYCFMLIIKESETHSEP